MLVPAHPVLSWNAFAKPRQIYAGSLLEGRRTWLFTSGRVALVHALRAWGVAAGDEVLVPAYHCLAMVTPLAWMGLKPVFYPLRADLTPDPAVISSLTSARTRALLVVHYFGFSSPLTQLREHCSARGLALVEDCAHAFYTQDASGAPLGRTADYAICSPMKFLPLFDGGALVTRSSVPAPSVQMHSPGMGYEIKAAVDVLERAAELSTLAGVSGLIRAASALKRMIRKRPAVAVPAAVEGGFGFDPAWLSVQPSAVSRGLAAHADRAAIADARRRHYRQLVERLSGMSGIELPFPTLDSGTVPYVMPLLADDGERLFWHLRSCGVQIFRWEFTETQSCPVTRSYARRLLQLPCHQSLSQPDIDRIVSSVRERPA